MPEIIGVRFRGAGKVYFFDPGEFPVHYRDHVIVETAKGIDYGTVVLSPTEVAEDKIRQPLKSVLRIATAEDTIRAAENREKEKEAYRICREKIAEHKLEMKLIAAEYTFDNSKVLFYFTADGRIDFRELVKDLAGIFRKRIELRQIGVRDETKLLGGIGTCGRTLCCHTWLDEFAPVSIRMAKEQNLSLNPAKISGTCGRLMCCLKNEADTYAYLNKGMPGRGDYVTTPDGRHGDVQSVNILRQTVRVIVELDNDEKELQEFDVKDITFIPKSQKPKRESGQQAAKRDNKPKDARSEKYHSIVNEKLREAGGSGENKENAEEAGAAQRSGGKAAPRRRPEKEAQDAESGNSTRARRVRGAKSRTADAAGGVNADGARPGKDGREGRRGVSGRTRDGKESREMRGSHRERAGQAAGDGREMRGSGKGRSGQTRTGREGKEIQGRLRGETDRAGAAGGVPGKAAGLPANRNAGGESGEMPRPRKRRRRGHSGGEGTPAGNPAAEPPSSHPASDGVEGC